MSDISSSALPRQVADAYVDAAHRTRPHHGHLSGCARKLAPTARLLTGRPGGLPPASSARRCGSWTPPSGCPVRTAMRERRCGRLLRERLTAELAVHEAEEGLRAVSNLSYRPLTASPRSSPSCRPRRRRTGTAIVERLRAVPAAYEGYRSSLGLGLERKLYGGPRATATFVGQLTRVGRGRRGRRRSSRSSSLPGPESLRAELDEAAGQADRLGARAAGLDARRVRPGDRGRPRSRSAGSATPAGRGCTTARTSIGRRGLRAQYSNPPSISFTWNPSWARARAARVAPLQPGPQQYVTTGTAGSSSAAACSGIRAVGRWTAPGMCPWSQEAVERLSRTTKPGSPSAASAAATSRARPAWKASEAPK
ncbi:hypothetical protein SBADM41S_07596 [Streptomyces badius]